MPRAVNGTYTLPAGNPVVTATVISSVWANTTLADISTVLTASLDRSGNGAMLAGLKLFDGAIGAPGLTWSTETTSGLYRVSAGVFGYSISGVQKLQINTNGILVADGAVGTPGFSFISDPDSGIYHIGANNLGVAVNGAKVLDIATTGLSITGSLTQTGVFLAPDGLVGSPAYSFTSDSDTGVWRIGANNMGLNVGGATVVDIASTGIAVGTKLAFRTDTPFITGGNITSGTNNLAIGGGVGNSNIQFYTNNVLRVSVNVGNVTSAIPFLALDGAVNAPAYSFSGETTTGMWRVGTSEIRLSVGGSAGFGIEATQVYSLFVHSFADGAVGAPGIRFSGDIDTGFYRDTANQIGIALGGVTAGQIVQGSFTGTLVGCSTSPTVTVNYVRIGKNVRCWITSNLTATSNSSNLTITGAPAIITPSVQQNYCCPADCTDNGVAVVGLVNILNSGTAVFNRMNVSGSNITGGAWTGSGTKGVNANACWSYACP